MPDYEIDHTPERNTLVVKNEDGKEEVIGSTIEGSTNFSFKPEGEEYTEADFKDAVEDVLGSGVFEFSKETGEPYYHVVYTEHGWSHYHLAVQGDDRISLFVRTATTERSVKDFHSLLTKMTGDEWIIEKTETDLTGSGPNRDG